MNGKRQQLPENGPQDFFYLFFQRGVFAGVEGQEYRETRNEITGRAPLPSLGE